MREFKSKGRFGVNIENQNNEVKTMSKWIVFYNKHDKELAAYTESGTFAGEMESTMELLAYENEIPVDEIVVKEEERKG